MRPRNKRDIGASEEEECLLFSSLDVRRATFFTLSLALRHHNITKDAKMHTAVALQQNCCMLKM